MNLNINKQSKTVIITIIIVVVIILAILISLMLPKESSHILEKENFIAEEKTIENPTNNETTKYTKYTKDNITLNKYYYNDLESIKNEVMTEYNQYKDNSGFETKFNNSDKYIYMVACSETICFYTLGYENEIIQTIINKKNKDETSKIYTELIEGMKLK